MPPPAPRLRRPAAVVASAGLLLARTASGAGFQAADNVAAYWGQNSYGQSSGPLAQQRLSAYCANSDIDIIPLAFLLQITTGTGTTLMDCPQIGEDITTCQRQYGKTILLSIGGATYTEAGFTSEAQAISAAELVWATFGPAAAGSGKTGAGATETTRAETASSSSSSRATSTTTRTTWPPTTTMATTTDPARTPGLSATRTRTTAGPKIPGPTGPSSAPGTASRPPTPSAFPSIPDVMQSTTPPPTTLATTYGGARPVGLPGRGFSIVNVDGSAGAPAKRQAAPLGTLRPFHDAAVDGFDLDLESTTSHFVPFAKRLRQLMDASGGREYYLTAAPQCVFPDAAVGAVLDSPDVVLDAVFVQFYNNYCGVQAFNPSAPPGSFNLDVWDRWAKEHVAGAASRAARNDTRQRASSAHTRVFLGVPSGPTAAGSGYEDAGALAGVIAYCRQFSSFGGVMMWDASQAVANADFLSGVKSALLHAGPATATATTLTLARSTATATTTTTTTLPPTGSSSRSVARWTGTATRTTTASHRTTGADATATIAEPSIPPGGAQLRRNAREFPRRRRKDGVAEPEHWGVS